jgi:hypothetical protein
LALEHDRAVAQQSAILEREKRDVEAAATWQHVGKPERQIKLWIENSYLYEQYERRGGEIFVSFDCKLIRGATSVMGPNGIYSGTCTYTIKADQNDPAAASLSTASCTITVAETVTSITPKRIAGWSQEVDFSTLMNKKPPSCPIAGTEGKEFAYEHPPAGTADKR